MRAVDKVVDVVIFIALFASMILLINSIIFGEVLVLPVSFLLTVLIISGIYMVFDEAEKSIK